MSMEEMFAHFTGENAEVYNLLTKKHINQIGIKLGKKHMKESDWAYVRELLFDHNVIVLEPVVPDAVLGVREHVLYDNGLMVAFTNIESCREYVKSINRRDSAPNRLFQLGTMPFKAVAEVARKYETDLYIDLQIKENAVFMVYYQREDRLDTVRI